MDIFPEVNFYEPVSHRAFEKSNLKVDIIFSIGKFHSYENCFVVQATMSEEEKQQLRALVFKKVFGAEDTLGKVDQIMEKISDYLPSDKILVIKDSILEILGKKNPTKKDLNNSLLRQNILRIFDFLTVDKITIVDQVKDYKEAMNIAGRPLISDKSVTPNYVTSVIQSHDFNDPYTILGEDVAIPHGLPSEGVKKIGISLLIVREGFLYSKDHSLKLLFLIAPIDKKHHNQAIIDILTIAESPEVINDLVNAKTRQDVQTILKNICA